MQPYGTNDFGGFRNILPPGQNGFDDLAQAARSRRPARTRRTPTTSSAMYSSLTTAVPITESQIPQFYKDATFGVPSGDVAGTESPEPGVTIVRDSQFGVPHIYGDTRAELMFGIGYATAEDRLFFIDVLRHAGQRRPRAVRRRRQRRAWTRACGRTSPTPQQDLVQPGQLAAANLPDGQQICATRPTTSPGSTPTSPHAKSPLNTLTMMPAEYAAIGQPQGPQPFTVEDLVSIATLVGGIFGNGGGQQLSNARPVRGHSRRSSAPSGCSSRARPS